MVKFWSLDENGEVAEYEKEIEGVEENENKKKEENEIEAEEDYDTLPKSRRRCLDLAREILDEEFRIKSPAVLLNKVAPPGWENFFSDSKKVLSKIFSTLSEIENVAPLNIDMFKVFYLCPPEKIKIVILGQDPYPGKCGNLPQAVGMSFSVRRNDNVPKSLANIYKELESEYPETFWDPGHGDLTSWVKQGVFLLNTALSVTLGKPLSHCGVSKGGSKGINVWSSFMEPCIEYIISVNPNCIFFLWGSPAQKYESSLGKKNTVFKCSHPSPLSAHISFNGCNHFKDANKKLGKKDAIRWESVCDEEEE